MLQTLDLPPKTIATFQPVPQMVTRSTQQVWSYQDYLNLPDDGRRYEIIKGVLYISMAPTYDHQFTVIQLAIQLGSFVFSNKLGVILTAPFEVHLATDTRPVQPDVLFIKAERQPQTGAKFFEGAPDLVIEVISPSSVRLDRQIKFNVYEQAGISEYWLVDPKTQSVEVYTLAEGEYELFGQFVKTEVIQSKTLAEINIVTNSLFV